MLVLSGGVSAGKFDLVPEVLAELGVEQVFHKIALRPGKPLWFGVKQDGERHVLVFGLPGNPVSSLVCFELFVRPAIAALAGRGFAQSVDGASQIESYLRPSAGGRRICRRLTVASETAPSEVPVPLQASSRRNGSDLTVEILPWHGSADLATLARANGLARLPAEPRQFEPATRSRSCRCEAATRRRRRRSRRGAGCKPFRHKRLAPRKSLPSRAPRSLRNGCILRKAW